VGWGRHVTIWTTHAPLGIARYVTYFLPSGLSVASHEGLPNVTSTMQGLVAM
jgi:hypothetical protein